MKRSELKRSGPLKRSGGLRRSGPLKRTSKLAARSAKTADRDRRYYEQRDDYLARNPECQIRWDSDCTRWATEIDHAVNRGVDPPGVLDETNWNGTCWHCHHMKTNNPGLARQRGLYGRELRPERPDGHLDKLIRSANGDEMDAP